MARPRGRLSPGPLLRLRSDEQLVRLFRQGNEEAFRVIHDRYRPRLFAYARQMLSGSRQDAEDALQDVFVRAYGALRANDRDVSLRAWLYRVAHNRCIDELRRPAPPSPETLELIQPSASDPIAEAEQRESLRRLVEDVRRLPEQQRSALLMREIVGMSYTELASALDVTVPAVKSLLVRARIGLAQAAEARDTACASIREELTAAHDRGVRASGLAKRHLNDCSGCRAYKRELRSMRERFAALTPALGVTGVVAKLLGLGGGGAAAGTGAGAAAGAGGGAAAGGGVAAVASTAGGGLAVSATHVAAIVAAAAVAGGGAVEVQQTLAPVHHHASHHRTVASVPASGAHHAASSLAPATSTPVLPAVGHVGSAPHASTTTHHGHALASAASRTTKKTVVAHRTGPQTVAFSTTQATDETSSTTGGAAAPADDQIDESTLPPVPYQAGDEDDPNGTSTAEGTTDSDNGTTDGTGSTTGATGSGAVTPTPANGATGTGSGTSGASSSPTSGASQPPATSATTAPTGGATAPPSVGGGAGPAPSTNTAPPTAGLSGH